jgi:pyruvate, water dikinase
VYASAVNPDALSYRRRRGLGERDEQMAILVQRVSGPLQAPGSSRLAGVAFSRNLYAWNDRIDPAQGILRMVFGLGTRAVDRVGGRLPAHDRGEPPELRPEVGEKVARYSQRQVDVLDLETNQECTLGLAEVLEGCDFPHLHLLVSELHDGHLADPFSRDVSGPADRLVLTLNNLIRRTRLVPLLGGMLETLEASYGHPVDTEFTAFLDSAAKIHINLLQCRPLLLPGATGDVVIPRDLPDDRVLFRAHRAICGGVRRGIGYILYIDPHWYAGIGDPSRKKTLGRLVGRINRHPDIAAGKVLMMGPGRWGSGNLDLGVNVGYADIDHAVVLVELAREEHGHVPELSYGTHFFQDLVEDEVVYLPVYPDLPDAEFNQAFLDRAPNLLARLLPDAADFADLVKVIDVDDATGGRALVVVADPARQEAVAFFEGE